MSVRMLLPTSDKPLRDQVIQFFRDAKTIEDFADDIVHVLGEHGTGQCGLVLDAKDGKLRSFKQTYQK